MDKDFYENPPSQLKDYKRSVRLYGSSTDIHSIHANSTDARATVQKSTDANSTDEKSTSAKSSWPSRSKSNIRESLRPRSLLPKEIETKRNKAKMYGLYGYLVALTIVCIMLLSVSIHLMLRNFDIEEKMLKLDKRLYELEKDKDRLKSHIKDLENKAVKINSEIRNFKQNTSNKITMINTKMRDLKQNTTKEKTKVNSEIRDLKQNTSKERNEMNSEIRDLKQKSEEFELMYSKFIKQTSHTEIGEVGFYDGVLSSGEESRSQTKTVTFDTAYDKPPIVFVSVTDLFGVTKSDNDPWYQVVVPRWDITKSGFTVKCTAYNGSHFEWLIIDWISFPTY